MGPRQNFIKIMNNHLSILKNADSYSITYYVGNKFEHVSHLKNCTLICKQNFEGLKNVEQIIVEDPQLHFYRISKQYAEDYIDPTNLRLINGSYIHRDAKIHPNVKIHPGCTIGKVIIDKDSTIHSGCVIYSKTSIGKNTYIEANTVVGAAGMMWVWDGDEKVFLEQLGSVKIGNNCRIGSNITIVRGSANEVTKIGDSVCIAHGTKIGHGCVIGNNVHFANNVSLGGSVKISNESFLGCGSTISPGVSVNKTIILGVGACLTKNADKSGIYVGLPAVWKKNIEETHSGVPVNTNRKMIVGIGLPRTGTRSLAAALDILGYEGIHYCELLGDTKKYGESNNYRIDNSFYHSPDSYNPNNLYILTNRDRGDWVESISKFNNYQGPDIVEYLQQCSKRFKSTKTPYLIYNVKDGWKPLCNFLGVDIPDVKFPKIY